MSSMTIPLDEIKARLLQAFPGAQVEVGDMTGTGDHIQVLVVSEKFQGKSLLEQHRMVYAPFEQELGGAIHAFSIRTQIPSK